MNYITLKIIISVATWFLFYFVLLQKPILKLIKTWGFATTLALICIISFCWAWFIGEMTDLVHNHYH